MQEDESPLTRSSPGKWRHLRRDLQLTRLSTDRGDEVPLISLECSTSTCERRPGIVLPDANDKPELLHLSSCRFGESYECFYPLIRTSKAVHHISAILSTINTTTNSS